MSNEFFTPAKGGLPAKGRALNRLALALMCSVLTAAPIASSALAHGFGGGGFGGGRSFGGGGHNFGGGHSFAGGMNGHGYGGGRNFSTNVNGWGRHPSYTSASRTPNPARPPYNSPRGTPNPPGHGYPAYPRGPWHHPIDSGYSPVGSTPIASTPSYPVPVSSVPVSPLLQPPSGPQQQQVSQAAQRTRSGVPLANETRFVPDEVMFTVSGSSQIAEAIGQKHHLTLVSSHNAALIGGGTLNRYKITDHRTVPEVIRDLETEQQITWAQPNYIFKLEGVETAAKGLAGAQYTIGKMHLTEAHRVTEGDGALVAIIDSGIDEDHSDLAGAVADRIDLAGGDTRAHAHGTAIAGAISAHGALTGVAPNAKILAIRAFCGCDTKPGDDGTTAHVIDGLEWAYKHHARIVNMSFAGAYDPLLALAISTAHQKDMILIAAAGNEGPTAKPAYPAADPNVIAVTATDRNDQIFSAANRGSYISLAAPGADIIAAAPSNSYQFSSGTSIAAAHISGVAALLISEKPDLGADTIRRVLKDTAHVLGANGQDEEFGAGLGDASRAVNVIEILRSQENSNQDSTGQMAETK